MFYSFRVVKMKFCYFGAFAKILWATPEKSKKSTPWEEILPTPMTEMFQKKQLGVLEVIAVRKGKTLVIRAWASEECFPGGPLEDFSKIFLGGQKW